MLYTIQVWIKILLEITSSSKIFDHVMLYLVLLTFIVLFYYWIGLFIRFIIRLAALPFNKQDNWWAFSFMKNEFFIQYIQSVPINEQIFIGGIMCIIGFIGTLFLKVRVSNPFYSSALNLVIIAYFLKIIFISVIIVISYKLFMSIIKNTTILNDIFISNIDASLFKLMIVDDDVVDAPLDTYVYYILNNDNIDTKKALFTYAFTHNLKSVDTLVRYDFINNFLSAQSSNINVFTLTQSSNNSFITFLDQHTFIADVEKVNERLKLNKDISSKLQQSDFDHLYKQISLVNDPINNIQKTIKKNTTLFYGSVITEIIWGFIFIWYIIYMKPPRNMI